jgi:hypothetical protein
VESADVVVLTQKSIFSATDARVAAVRKVLRALNTVSGCVDHIGVTHTTSQLQNSSTN